MKDHKKAGDMSPDIHALSGAYAVDALDDVERQRFEKHLVDCEACRDEVASLQDAAATFGGLAATPPPPALRDRVLSDITSVRPLPPQSPTAAGSRGRRKSKWRPVIAAAAVLVAIGTGAVVFDQVRGDDTVQTVSAADRVLAAKDARTVSLSFPDGASAKVVHSATEGRAVLLTDKMPAAPTGKVYELWLQDDAGAMVPAGLMDEGGSQKVLLEGDASAATGVGITVEPAGGSEQPTSDPIALFDFSKAT